MREIKVLWVDDDPKFGPSIHFRVESELRQNGIVLVKPEVLVSGEYLWETVRDFAPDIILMDHNLESVNTNGALLTTEIRFRNNETPIIYYSSEMGPDLMKLVENEHRVFTSTRGEVHSEFIRIIKQDFS